MLVTLSFVMLACFIYILISGRLSAAATLVLVPTTFALLGGFGPDLGQMIINGIKTVAPTGVLLIFAMIYFMTMTDAGMFDPIIRRIVGAVGGDPMKVLLGSVALGYLVALDGDGATVYMIVLSAFLPIYRRLGISLIKVACLMLQCTGVGNLLPWGGPTARAATSMHVDMSEVFTPLVVPLLACVSWAFLIAWIFGKQERKRLGVIDLDTKGMLEGDHAVGPRFYFNWVLTILLMIGLVMEVLPLAYLFMVGAAIALTVNFPKSSSQQEQLAQHAPAILHVAMLLFSASVFIGVLSETGMANAVANAIVSSIPEAVGPRLAVVTAILSIPMTWLVSNDVFYFGMLPILAQAAAKYGITPAEMARAALVGQPVHILSPLVASTYLLVSMLELNYGKVQRFTIGWSTVTCLLMLFAATLCGVIPV
ncbi:citrate:proton symporter [Ensifer sp. SSB1]|uniref:CitMHS family transporter n=1 Tax=Ensifer sp. SSB1 TaxID=2795385 RepID=UPI001A4DCA0E|nr:citrate:proton symporter [Ensifer sp. SSB1]MBK5567885.1 citrate transporter [Ensifer sp. SSB1]